MVFFYFQQPPEEGTDEYAPPIINSRWIAHKTQKLSNMFEPSPEDLIEKEAEKPSGGNLILNQT